jgi:hypothetical protein
MCHLELPRDPASSREMRVPRHPGAGPSVWHMREKMIRGSYFFFCLAIVIFSIGTVAAYIAPPP